MSQGKQRNARAVCRTHFPDEETTFKVQIVYEDFIAGLRAKRFMSNLETRLPFESLKLSLWRFDLLKEPTLRHGAASEAIKADLLLLSAHGWRALPEAVDSWLGIWSHMTLDEPPALVLLLDSSAQNLPAANHIVASVRQKAQAGRLDLFHTFDEGFDHIQSLQRRKQEPFNWPVQQQAIRQ